MRLQHHQGFCISLSQHTIIRRLLLQVVYPRCGSQTKYEPNFFTVLCNTRWYASLQWPFKLKLSTLILVTWLPLQDFSQSWLHRTHRLDLFHTLQNDHLLVQASAKELYEDHFPEKAVYIAGFVYQECQAQKQRSVQHHSIWYENRTATPKLGH